MKIIDVLLKQKVITEEQFDKAKKEAQKTGLTLDRAVVRLGFVSEESIAKTMASEMNVPYMDLKGYVIDQAVIKLVPEETAKKFKALPLFKVSDSLTVAMTNPHDIFAIDEIREKSGFASIEPVYSLEADIEKAIEQNYGVSGTVEDMIRSIPKKSDITAEDISEEKLAEIIQEAPVVKLVNLLVTQAVKERASDIHIEPDEKVLRIRYRVDGIMYEVTTPPKNLQNAIISRIKVLSKMDITERRKPQDGRFTMKLDDKEIDIRASTFPTTHGENLVLRILDKASAIMRMMELGMSAGVLKKYEELIKKPHGILLVTGPTGSGKTTTLYASLSSINSIEKNILTIEDPVEYELPLIRQTQINPKAGLTFASGLRNMLRQDPDIIMVGEIRDKETVEIAIQAALTGHLVLSTLHTNDAASALTRLVDMGVEPFLLSSTVIGIVAQRLVRIICPKCKEEYAPTEEELADFGVKEKIKLFKGKGCQKCRNAGYTGRIGIYELLIMDENIKKIVLSKDSSSQIKKEAVDAGMITLYQNGLQKAEEGVTTIEEVLRVTEDV